MMDVLWVYFSVEQINCFPLVRSNYKKASDFNMYALVERKLKETLTNSHFCTSVWLSPFDTWIGKLQQQTTRATRAFIKLKLRFSCHTNLGKTEKQRCNLQWNILAFLCMVVQSLLSELYQICCCTGNLSFV